VPALHDEVSLDISEQPFDLPFRLRLLAIDRCDPEFLGVPLKVRFPSPLRRAKLACSIGEDGRGQAKANERVIEDLIDINPVLAVKPLSIGDKAAMVIEKTDQIQTSDEREMRFAHDVDLPERIRLGRFESLHPFDRRQGEPAEMVPNEDPPNRFPMNKKTQMVLDESGRPVLAFLF
jgi:hypothetical protein